MNPKGTQNGAKSHPSGHGRTSPKLWQAPHGWHIGPLRMRSNDDFFLNCFPDATFYMFLSTLTENHAKRSPNGTSILRKNGVFFDSFPKSSPTGPQGGSRPPKRHRNGAPGHQNGARGPSNRGFLWPEKLLNRSENVVISDNLKTVFEKRWESCPFGSPTTRVARS